MMKQTQCYFDLKNKKTFKGRKKTKALKIDLACRQTAMLV